MKRLLSSKRGWRKAHRSPRLSRRFTAATGFAPFACLLVLLTAFGPGWCRADVDTTMNKLLAPVAITTNAVVRASDQLDLEDMRLQTTEFLDLHLPVVTELTDLQFSLEPKFGDIVHRGYFRLPAKVQYAPVPHLMASIGLTPFIPSLGDFHAGAWGLGYVSEELRYDFHPRNVYFQDFIAGVEVDTPIGRPPIELINGFTHLRPYFSASKPLCFPHTTLLLDVHCDLAARWFHHAEPQYKYQVFQYGPALFYKPNQFGYLAQVALKQYQTPRDSFVGGLGRLGLQWDIPERRTHRWDLPGKWDVDLAVQAETNEQNKISTGISTQVHWKIDLRRHRHHAP